MFAVLEGVAVVNVILADSVEIAEEVTGKKCVLANGAQIGWTYNEETGEFIRPIELDNVVLAVEDVPEGEHVIKSFNPLPQEEPAAPTEA